MGALVAAYFALASAFALTLAPALAAADGPVMIPARDVAVTYQTDQRGHLLEQHLRWSAATRRLRVEPPTPGMFILVDYGPRRMQIVRETNRTYVDMSAPPTLPGLGAPAANYKKSGSDRILGLACTEWETVAADRTTAVCVTEDGVVLRVRMGDRVMATATAVSFANQDPSLFTVPAGFKQVEPPR